MNLPFGRCCWQLLVVAFGIAQAQAGDFNVTTPSNAFNYTINGTSGNPTLTLQRGQTYTFDVDTCSCHPFEIRGAPGGSVVNNNIFSGTITFTVPTTATNYSYRCSIHLFSGTINTVAPAQAPAVTTNAATSIGGTSATLNASVNPNGAATTAAFIYGTDPTLTTNTLIAGQSIGSGSAAVAVNASVASLSPATTYYFRAQATNATGTTPGSILSFTTKSDDATLSNLTLSPGTLSPTFDPLTLAYTASVTVPQITVTPTATQSGATIKVNGASVNSGVASSAISLSGGPNTITVTVTAPDGVTKKDYAMTITADLPHIVIESPPGTPEGSLTAVILESAAPGSSVTNTFRIKNTGTQDLTGLSSSIVGTDAAMFQLTSTLPSAIAPGNSFDAEVQFTPTMEGTHNATLQLSSNDAGRSPLAIALSGRTHVVKFETASFTQREDAVTLQVPVRLSAPLGRAWSIPVTYSGTATNNSDYTHSASPLNFSATQTVANITITLKDESSVEGDETILIDLGLPSDSTITWAGAHVQDGVIVSPQPRCTVTIVEDDVLPVIAPLPASDIVAVGDSVAFTSNASGSAPLSFAWKKNNVAIAGATSTSFNIGSAVLGDAGAYSFAATNQRGTATSTAQLAVVDRTPQIVRANVAASANLSIIAAGNSLTYRWRKGGNDLSNGSKYANVTTKTLSVKGLLTTDAGDYTCMVTSPGGALESGAVSLQVPSLPPLADTPAFPEVVIYNAFSHQLTFDSAPERAPTKFVCSGLPSGVTCNATTGLISGKPTRSGDFPIMVTVTNSAGTPSVVNGTIKVHEFPLGCIGSYVGWISRDGPTNASLGGRIDFATSSSGSCTGMLRLGAESYNLKTNLLTAPTTGAHPGLVLSIARSNKRPNLVLTLDLDPATNVLGTSVQEVGAATSATITGWRNVWHTTAPANAVSAQFGAHTFRLDPDATGPQGYGYANLAITASGGTTINGRTADGGILQFSGLLGPAGEVLVFQSLYSNKGSLLGQFTVAGDADHTIHQTLSWQKTLVTAARDYAPFGPIAVTAVGGKYTHTSPVLALPAPLVGASNAQFTFNDGGVGASVTAPQVLLRITDHNAISIFGANPGAITSLSLSSSAVGGSFSGKFTLFDVPNRTVSFQGMLVSPPGRGYGYFLLPQKADALAIPPTTSSTSPILSGKVILSP